MWVQRSSFGSPWGTTREIYTPVERTRVYDAVAGQLAKCEEDDDLSIDIEQGLLKGANIQVTMRTDIGIAAFQITQRGRVLASSYVVWKPEGLHPAFSAMEETYMKVTDHGSFVQSDSAKVTAPTTVPWVGELLTATLGVYRQFFKEKDPKAVDVSAWLGEIMEVLPSVGLAILESQWASPTEG
jgi:hypothetical protein